MYKLAFINGNTLVYWHTVILVLAILTGILFFLSAFYRRFGELTGAAVAAPLTVILSLVLARLAHWYFRPDGYDSLVSAMTDFSGTGYALVGVFAGCALSACLLRLLGTVRSLPGMLDCMSIGGCAAICLGRLSSFFTPDDRGEILTNLIGLPFSWPVINATSGQTEYRLATFLFQSLAAGILFVILFLMFQRSFRRKHRQDGDITLLFLLVYCATQVVLDSTRYDGLHLRSNGFISIVQVLSAVGLVTVIIIYSAQMIRKSGMNPVLPVFWVITAAGIGLAGFMEYYVQRHGDKAVIAYSVMSVCMYVIVLVGILLHTMGKRGRKKNAGKFRN